VASFSFEFDFDQPHLPYSLPKSNPSFEETSSSLFVENEHFIWIANSTLGFENLENIKTQYHDKGMEAFSPISGGLAVLVFDKTQKKISLFRDFLGVKPLYFFKKNNLVKISTTLKVLQKGSKSSVNLPYLRSYFGTQYETQPISQETFFEDIMRVLPGHTVEISTEGFKQTPLPIPELDKNVDFKTRLLENIWAAENHFRHLGSHLSGGLDSSALVCALKNTNNLHTFFYDSPNSNEKPWVAEVVNFKQTVHHNIIQKPFSLASIRTAVQLTHTPELLVIPSSVFIDLVAEAKISQTNAVLSGHGGDSIVGFGFEYLDELWQKKEYVLLKAEIQNYVEAQKQNEQKKTQSGIPFDYEHFSARFLLQKAKQQFKQKALKQLAVWPWLCVTKFSIGIWPIAKIIWQKIISKKPISLSKKHIGTLEEQKKNLTTVPCLDLKMITHNGIFTSTH
jgi:asparagine synthetase B (glutamine-hydrolysing)